RLVRRDAESAAEAELELGTRLLAQLFDEARVHPRGGDPVIDELPRSTWLRRRDELPTSRPRRFLADLAPLEQRDRSPLPRHPPGERAADNPPADDRDVEGHPPVYLPLPRGATRRDLGRAPEARSGSARCPAPAPGTTDPTARQGTTSSRPRRCRSTTSRRPRRGRAVGWLKRVDRPRGENDDHDQRYDRL